MSGSSERAALRDELFTYADQLRRMETQAGFACKDTSVRVKDPDFLATLLVRAGSALETRRVAELEAENARLKADLAFYGEHIMDLECEATRRNAQVERLRAALSAVVHPSLVDAIARGDASSPTPMLPDGNGQA